MLREANAFVTAIHRHHKAVQGQRFSVGAIDEVGKLRGVAIGSRPVARMGGHPRHVLEVTRVATDGCPNACSFLYGVMARIGRAMGFARGQTFILESETGVSLRAAGWRDDGEAGGGSWSTGGRGRVDKAPTEMKRRYVIDLGPAAPTEVM